MKPTLLALLCLGVALPGAARAADASYLDDRSNAAALVKSLYNAVNRHEYARAWDYFGQTKPSKNFDAFVKGYGGTERVDVATGAVAAEGAAGSSYFYVPVAINSVGTDGSEQVYAGCYTARLVNPQIQETPFSPMHLEKGSLKPSDQPLAEAVPASCPDAPAPDAADALFDQVKAAFAATHSDQCANPDERQGEDDGRAPASYVIRYNNITDAADEPQREARLFRFFCYSGAYNESHIYYLHNDIDGLDEVHFATPELDIRYENDDFEGKLDSMEIIGYHANGQLVNSDYDEATRTITSYAKWRGVGDASSSGLWLFRDGKFTLVRYEVDPTYDGEINPQTVLDYDTAP